MLFRESPTFQIEVRPGHRGWCSMPLLFALGLFFAVGALSPLGAPVTLAIDKADLFADNERAKDLVAWITGESTEGSAVVFQVEDKSLLAFTAKHVVFQQGDFVSGLQARFRSWPGHGLPAKVDRLHHQLDLAVLRIDLRPLGLSRQEVTRAFTFDQLGNTEILDPGADLNTVGHARADAWISPELPLAFSTFERSSGSPPTTFRFEYNCPRGHSGGPVFDGEWRMVGMMLEFENPHCRALSIDEIRKVLQGWKYDIALREDTRNKGATEVVRRTIKVAVFGFDNRSTATRLANLGHVAQDIVSSLIFNLDGVTLLSRDRLASVEREIYRGDTVGSTQGLSRIGRLLDADAVITGSVIRYDIENQVINAYGTNARIDTYRMDISLQILDVDTAQVQFAKTFDVEERRTYPRADSAPRQPVDLTTELLKRLLDSASEDLQRALTEITSGLQTAGQRIVVPIDSVPSGAEVLINEVYRGTTPLELELSYGLQVIEIRHAGYEDWIRRVEIEPGKEVKANLMRR